MKKALSSVNAVQAILFACLLIALASFAYNGSFSRLIADDYCTAAIGSREGIVGGMLNWYTNWAGLYTNFLIKSTFGYYHDAQFMGWLPLILLIIWVSLASWACYQIACLFRIRQPRITGLLAGMLIVTATAQGAPVIIQSLYWMGGAIPYTGALIAATAMIGVFAAILRPERSALQRVGFILLGGVIAFAGGGLTEVYATLQLPLLVIMAVIAFIVLPAGTHRRQVLLFVGLSIIGGLIALGLVLAAPGNAVRQANYPPPPSLIELIPNVITGSLSVISVSVIVFGPLPLLVVLLVFGLLAYKISPPDLPFTFSRRQIRLLLAFIAGASLLLITAAITPAIYATGTTPPGRVFIIPMFILVWTAAGWGYVMGLSLKRPAANPYTVVPVWVTAVIILCCLLGPLNATLRNLSQTPILRAYAQEWDMFEDTLITAAAEGNQEVVTQQLEVDLGKMVGLKAIEDNTEEEINRCLAELYGLSSITAIPLENEA